jgi:hypothetical protein
MRVHSNVFRANWSATDISEHHEHGDSVAARKGVLVFIDDILV